jgi:class 3 adenylate cyclase/tetratricopeptide (TPR) repeat protein
MTQSLGDWFAANGVSEYEEVFAENQVDWEVLPLLTEADLKDLGIPLGPRKRILYAIAKLKTQADSRPADAEARLALPAGERRHLTVMFCDLVGSTALSHVLDPEELNALIQVYRRTCGDVVARYEGYVAQYLGDGLLAYFGWPVGYEDAAERGVRAALDIVQAVKAIRAARPLQVRIGLATGPVVVGAGGADTGLAVGETPNMAARLQGLAEPGEVVIAPATRHLLSAALSLTDLGLRPLKGIDQPVRAWRVNEVRRTEGRFEAAHAGVEIAPLIGRDDEIAQLERCWQQARAGSGQVVQISGPAGIGKSRLTQSLRERIDGAHAILHYQCSPYRLDSPLYPIIEELELAAGFSRDDTPAQRLQKLEAVFREVAPTREETVPLMAALLSVPVEGYAPLGLSPQKQKERTLETLVERVHALAGNGPVLIVIEDVHWIDPTSQELLELLVPQVSHFPVLLILTYRVEYVSPWSELPSVTTLLLTRLNRQQGARLVVSVTGGRPLPAELLDEILERTDGVPLFVEELTRSVLESGQLRQEGDHYVLESPLLGLMIPASLRDSLMARLDRLGRVKELAQIGACIGREFSFELLLHISAMPPEELERELEKLAEAGLVSRSEPPPRAIYRFKHALVQDAAYDSLLKSRRRELHARIAVVLETDFADRVANAPDWLAHHHTEAGHLTKAIPLWRKAGMLAMARVALKEAVAHFMKGLRLVDQMAPSPERDSLELAIREPLNAAWTGQRGWAASEVGENAKAILGLAESLGNRRSLLLAMWWAWTSTITQGRIADSRRWVDRLLAEAEDTGDADMQIFGQATAMVQCFLNGRLSESRAHADRALALYDPGRAEKWIQMTGHDLRTFVEVYTCQLIWIMGYPEQARKMSDESARHARGNGHAFNLVWALTFSAYVFAYRREPDLFMDRVGEADRVAEEQGLAFIHEVSVPQAKGIAELQNGRPAEAIALLRQGIERWTRTGGNVRIPLLKSALAVAVGLEGDTRSALELVDECIAQIERPEGQERLWLAEVLRSKGWILLNAGRLEEAEAQLRASIECARRQEAKSWELRSAMLLAGLLAQRGDVAGAHGLLSPIYEWFTENEDSKDLIEARELLKSFPA